MRARFLLVTALALLTACDAGHRDGERAEPGGDNAFPGPELAVTAPGPGQVFPVWKVVDEKDEDGKDRQRKVYKLPTAMFDLRNAQRPDRREGDRVHYILDRGPVRPVADHTRPVKLEDGDPVPQPSGTRVLRAFVAKADGTPYANPEACAVRMFHLGRDDGSYDLRPGDGVLRAPFRDDGAHLILLPAQGTTLRFAVSGARLGERRYRVHLRLGESEASVFEAGAVDLQSLFEDAAGEVTVELQKLEPGDKEPVWVPVPGPFNRETVKLGD